MNPIDYLVTHGAPSRYAAWQLVIGLVGMTALLAVLLRIVWDQLH